MISFTWGKGQLKIQRNQPKPESKPQPAQPAQPRQPRQLADFLRRCPVCRKLRAQPGENPGMVAGACMCDANRERDALADRVSGLHF